MAKEITGETGFGEFFNKTEINIFDIYYNLLMNLLFRWVPKNKKEKHL